MCPNKFTYVNYFNSVQNKQCKVHALSYKILKHHSFRILVQRVFANGDEFICQFLYVFTGQKKSSPKMRSILLLYNDRHICRIWPPLLVSGDLDELWLAPFHDDIIKWKHFRRYWPFVWGSHRSSVDSPHTDQWRRALMFSLICACTNG